MRACSNVPIVGELQTLSLNRGTTLLLKARRIDLDGEPILDVAEQVYFTIKNMWRDTNYRIRKSLGDGMTFDEEGWYHIRITPEDTEDLPYGNYVWDFTVLNDNGGYREKPARGFLVVGNSSGWIVNQED